MRGVARAKFFIFIWLLGAGLAAGCQQKAEPTDPIPEPGETLSAAVHSTPQTDAALSSEPVQTPLGSGNPMNGPAKPVLTTAQKTYSQSDQLEFTFIVGEEIIYSIGPCNFWFERRVNLEWVKAGSCPNSSFTDEPFSLGSREELSFVLAHSYESEDHYSYTLTAGKYRFAFSFWTSEQDHVVYSPAFEIGE